MNDREQVTKLQESNNLKKIACQYAVNELNDRFTQIKASNSELNDSMTLQQQLDKNGKHIKDITQCIDILRDLYDVAEKTCDEQYKRYVQDVLHSVYIPFAKEIYGAKDEIEERMKGWLSNSYDASDEDYAHVNNMQSLSPHFVGNEGSATGSGLSQAKDNVGKDSEVKKAGRSQSSCGIGRE